MQAAQGSNMASGRLLLRTLQEEPRPAKYSLLIIIGRISHPSQAGHVGKEIERGILSWDVNLVSCNLNLYLQEFLSHHTVSFKGAGQRSLRHSNKVLDTQVLLSPSQERVHSEVCGLLAGEAGHKLLVLAGQSVEESGDLLLNRGLFSPHQLKHILTEQLVDLEDSVSSLSQATLTLSCPNIGQWRTTLLADRSPQGPPPTLLLNPPEVLPAMEALQEFTSLVCGSLCPPSPFDLLPPPGTVGFLKLSRPCCYVFPAGRGNCAFFAVSGFTVLVDGGADPQACFWKLVRHLDRVDAVLLTHIGPESLPGVNVFLERKVAEQEMGSEVKDDLSKRLISPELGVVFFNGPSSLQNEQQPCMDNVLKSRDLAALTLKMLKKLDITPEPMFRPRGVPIQPLTLFQKMGVGHLELYVLSPGAQEYQTLMQSWPDATSTTPEPKESKTLPVTALASASVLLVWHPACPQEKVVRVLFPGATPQGKLLEGLDKLRGLAFLQKPTVTTGELEGSVEDRRAKLRENQSGGKSPGKESTPRQGKERGSKDEGKERGSKDEGKERGSKDEGKERGNKDEGKEGLVKDKREEGKRDVDKDKPKEKQRAVPSDKNTLKKGGGRGVRKEEKVVKKEDAGSKRKEHVKSLPSKPKNESTKTKPKKDAKNDSKTGGKNTSKPSGKEIKTDSNLDAKKASHGKNHTAGPNAVSVSDGRETKAPDREERNGKTGTESEENPCGSKTSTPEDMTSDFLRLREEAEEARVASGANVAGRGNEAGEERSVGGLGEDYRALELLGEETAGGARIKNGGSDRNEGAGDKVGVVTVQLETVTNPERPKVVGFPCPFNKTPRNDFSVPLDLTPTEYTLLDGALRHSPPSRSSPEENPARLSPDEETVEPASSDSRPNSAGHTPYCLSPDDVWCSKDTLNRLTSQTEPLEPAEVNQPPGSNAQGEGQLSESKSALESQTTSNPREKHLSFLSLGSFKDGVPDPSPSVTTTTTTTHSMPAEVSSPQSTEVDESLSMSFEQGPTVSQREGEDGIHLSHSNGSHFVESDFRVGMSLPLKKPPRSLGQGSETGPSRPGPNALHFESAAHDVDLCLVSPCEFKHFKAPDSSSGTSDAPGAHHHGNNNNNNHNNKDTSASESNAPLCAEDCPSTTADGVLDSDEDESCSEPTNILHDHHTHRSLPADPPPAPMRDSPPLAPQPDSCMPVPQSDSEVHGKGTKVAGLRGKRSPVVSEVFQRSGKGRTGSQSGATKGVRDAPRTTSSSTKSAPAKSPTPGSRSSPAEEVSVYVDLAYVPSGASSPTVDVEFFKRVRSSCYIISGDGPEGEELMRRALNALLDGKTSWTDSVQVTVIPTFESASMQEWYQQTLERQRALGITVLGSNSTVAMQDETFPACKIEF